MECVEIQVDRSCQKRVIMHADFRLNGISHDLESLLLFANHLCKSTHNHEIEIGQFLVDWFSNESYIKLQTSGSTGKPTQILAPKSMLSASAFSTIDALDLLPRQRALLCLPIQFIAGKMMLIRALLAGLWIDIVKPTAQPLTSKSYDFVAMTPYQLRNAIGKIDLVKQIIVGGAPIDIKLRNAVKGLSTRVISTYGMTETYSHIALQDLSKGETHYTAIQGVSFSVHDDALAIHAPHLGIDTLVTSDNVELISPTQFIWKGRNDHVINSGGIKLHPEEIEKKLAKIIMTPFFVFGKDDEKLGRSISIVFEGHKPKGVEAMISQLNTLTTYEKPKDYFVISQFVRTNGKILRNQTIQTIDFS